MHEVTKMRIFEIENKSYEFSSSKFTEIFNTFRKQNKLKSDELEQSMADSLFVQKSTVHSWRFGRSGPSDLDIIKKLANYLKLADYTYLLKEKNEMIKLNELQMQSVKKIYDALVSFLHEFLNTGGFTTSMWYDFLDKGSKNPESDIYDYIENLEDRIELIIKQEYFYLRDLSIYNELCDFVHGDLVDIYNGKLGYAYRVECFGDAPTTYDDYLKTWNKLNSIIEKYC